MENLEYKLEMAKKLYEVVFVLGGPGAGKGTQCAKLVDNYGFVHLSAGDLLRAERNDASSDLGEMINTFIAEGKIVPAEVTVRLLRTAMEKAKQTDGKRKFLIDGFPRNMENYMAWDVKMGPIVDVKFLLFLDCPEDVMTERLLKRGETSGRNDDNVESIKKRLVTYRESTMPIIEKFKEANKCVHVNANRAVDVVFGDIKPHVEYVVVFVLGGPGSGKGTNCARIVDDYGYIHLSAGDLLRAERSSGSDLGDMISEYIKEGKIVPVEVTVRLLKNAMEKSGGLKFLIDGFPRNLDNLQGWIDQMSECSDVKFCLFLDCPEKTMEERLIVRGQTSGRSDDNIESIRKRFKTYQESTMPIINRFSKEGKLRRVISDRELDAVYSDVSVVMKSLELILS